MKVRLLGASACLLALGAATLPAHATPYVGSFRYLDSGTITVRGADGARWLVDIGATQGGQVESRAEQSLYVDISRCTGSTCVTKAKWSRPLTAAEISISQVGLVALATNQQVTGKLHTLLGGRDLVVSLTGHDVAGTAVDSVQSSTDPIGVGPGAEQWNVADGTVSLGGLRCKVLRGDGTIGEVQRADTVGDDARDPRTAPPARLPAGFLTGPHRAHC